MNDLFRIEDESTAQAYAPLREALEAAYSQASGGKGKERHANGKPFNQQPIMEIARMVGPGYQLGQAMKKAQESKGMFERGSNGAAQAELLGAINYLAAAWLLIGEKIDSEKPVKLSATDELMNNLMYEIINTKEDTCYKTVDILSIYDPRVLESFELAHNDLCESSYGIRTETWERLDPEMKMSIISVNLDRLKDKHWRLTHRDDKALSYLLDRAATYLKGRDVLPK